MDYNINLKHDSSEGYFISIENSVGRECEIDGDIAEFLGISVDFYYNKAIEYGAYGNIYNQLFFKRQLDILDFKKWLEDNLDYFLIAKKIEGN